MYLSLHAQQEMQQAAAAGELQAAQRSAAIHNPRRNRAVNSGLSYCNAARASVSLLGLGLEKMFKVRRVIKFFLQQYANVHSRV